VFYNVVNDLDDLVHELHRAKHCQRSLYNVHDVFHLDNLLSRGEPNA